MTDPIPPFLQGFGIALSAGAAIMAASSPAVIYVLGAISIALLTTAYLLERAGQEGST